MSIEADQPKGKNKCGDFSMKSLLDEENLASTWVIVTAETGLVSTNELSEKLLMDPDINEATENSGEVSTVDNRRPKTGAK